MFFDMFIGLNTSFEFKHNEERINETKKKYQNFFIRWQSLLQMGIIPFQFYVFNI